MSANTLPSFANIDPNALNVAAAKGGEVLELIDNTMDFVRRQESTAIVAAIKAAFGVATALFLEGIAGACVGALGAGGVGYELSTVTKAEKAAAPEIKELQQKEEPFEKELTDKDTEIKQLDESQPKEPTLQEQREYDIKKAKLQRERTNIAENKRKNRDQIDEKNRQVQSVNTKANTRTQIWGTASSGAQALSKGITNMLQEQQKAVQSITQQMQQMFSSTYNKAKEIGTGFWNIKFFEALQALAVALK